MRDKHTAARLGGRFRSGKQQGPEVGSHIACLGNGKEAETRAKMVGGENRRPLGAQILRKTFTRHGDYVCQGRRMASTGCSLQIPGCPYFVAIN